MTFPGVVALSHCWLALAHPGTPLCGARTPEAGGPNRRMCSAGVRAPLWADPDARNLREKWLPAIEWYYSERVRRACEARNGKDKYGNPISEAMKAAWAGVSDAELLERCDFGIFIECARAARTRAAAPRAAAPRPRSSRGLAA